VNKRKRSATIKFSGIDDVTATSALKFRCSLDGKKAHGCKSPVIYRKLKPGRHKLAVTAADAAGNVSAPAKASFKVPRKKHHRHR
jgi:hypothetical protein